MNNKEILIVCALEQETQEELNDWEPFADDPVWDILYTGVGKVNATLKLTQRLQINRTLPPMPKLVINYGTAGSQSRRYSKGDLVDCTRFVQRDMDVTGLGFKLGQTPFEEDIPIILQSESEFNPIGKNALCGSGDSFVDGDVEFGNIVDMEAYALAKVCRNYDVPFISFKYITDNANEHSVGDWNDNLGKGIVEFKEKILKELK